MRILLAPLGSHGDVHPFLGLGLALRNRGHEVHVITSPAFRSLCESLGFPFAPVGTDRDFNEMILNPDLWVPHRSFRALFGNRERMLRHLRDGYERIVERNRPGETVVVAGMLAFWARIARESPGIPLVTVHLQPSTMPSVADPPEFAQLKMRTWWPRWFRSLLYWYGDRCIVDPLVAPPINEFRATLGLAPIRRIIGEWGHSPDRIVGLFPAWYASAPDWPPAFRHAGFVRFDQSASSPLSPQLEAFLKAGEPPIVFSFGSAMRTGRKYFEAAVDACRILNRRGLLLAKGREQVPDPLPASIHHADYAPFSLVFPRSAAVVHHGGIGTCAQALAAGAPQLVMPLSFDQPDNARRLERLGAGSRLWPKRFTGARIADALFALLDSAATIMRCKDLGELAETTGDTLACEWIEDALANHLSQKSRE